MKNQAPSKRLLLVNRDFQFRYTRASVAVGVVSTALTATVILYPLYVFKILVVPQFLPTPILLGMLAAALLNIGLLIIFGILISHKIAGPMFSMVRHIRRLAGGAWTSQMNVRPGDDLQFLVRNLNDLGQNLSTTARKDLDLVEKALNLTDDRSQQMQTLQELKTRLTTRLSSPK
jgi:methyl-accepting chemotaxis protein